MPRQPTRLLAPLLALAVVAVSGPALADDLVRADCAPFAAAPLRFETAEQQRWYARFWNGRCEHLGMCLPGSPNWNEIVGKLLDRTPAPQKGTVLSKACRLGPVIGFEWSREKDVKRITTGDLRAFGTVLEHAPDVLTGLNQVEAQVRQRLAQAAPARKR